MVHLQQIFFIYKKLNFNDSLELLQMESVDTTRQTVYLNGSTSHEKNSGGIAVLSLPESNVSPANTSNKVRIIVDFSYMDETTTPLINSSLLYDHTVRFIIRKHGPMTGDVTTEVSFTVPAGTEGQYEYDYEEVPQYTTYYDVIDFFPKASQKFRGITVLLNGDFIPKKFGYL